MLDSLDGMMLVFQKLLSDATKFGASFFSSPGAAIFGVLLMLISTTSSSYFTGRALLGWSVVSADGRTVGLLVGGIVVGFGVIGDADGDNVGRRVGRRLGAAVSGTEVVGSRQTKSSVFRTHIFLSMSNTKAPFGPLRQGIGPNILTPFEQ